jgi:hypothetical protein
LVFVVVRSHGYSPALAPALSRQGLEGVVAALTGCRHYELCQARANLDEVLFQGRTTCRDTTLPLRLWTSRMTHQVIGIAAWLPDFAAPPANTKAQRKR